MEYIALIIFVWLYGVACVVIIKKARTRLQDISVMGSVNCYIVHSIHDMSQVFINSY